MADKKVKSLEDTPLDIYEALKRALIRRGFIPGKRTEKKQVRKINKLVDITSRSHEILFMADTVFPFTLFPSTITLDREKLTIAHRFFFRVAKIISVPIADILNVEADVGPFFGSVHVTSRYFATNPQSVVFLSRGNAILLQRLLQGYIIAHEREVDCSKIDKLQLVTLLNDLGQGASD